uniref:Uncharacterized protein n=1 Tax=Oryza rufipogon TaxID=4529 RepID=A0A0E0Q5M7_ORYRU
MCTRYAARFLASIKVITSTVQRGIHVGHVVHATSHMMASRLAQLRNLTAVSDTSRKDGKQGGIAAKTGRVEPARGAADRMMGVSAE